MLVTAKANQATCSFPVAAAGLKDTGRVYIVEIE